MEQARTCLGCRKRAPRASLLRVVVRDGEVVVDASATLHGRGAWLHPTRECAESAIHRNAFGRALRVGGAPRADSVLTHIGAPPVPHERTGTKRPMDK